MTGTSPSSQLISASQPTMIISPSIVYLQWPHAGRCGRTVPQRWVVSSLHVGEIETVTSGSYGKMAAVVGADGGKPATGRDDVKVLQYADRLKVFRNYECLAEYSLPPDGTRHQRYSPPGEPKPRYQPRDRRRPAKLEEKRLRALGDEVSAYLDFALSASGVQKHRFTRELFALSRKLTDEVFRKTAERAHRYRIVELATLRRIAWLCLSQEEDVLPELEVDEDFRQRPAYQEGYLTDQPDLSQYDQLREEEKKEDEHGEPF